MRNRRTPGLFGVTMHPEKQAPFFNPDPNLSVTMGLNWKSEEAVHVTQACEALLKSAGPGAKPRGLIVSYKGKQLPAKVILRMAYRLANNIPSETKLRFSSGEASLQRLRSPGFQAERLQNADR
jgi:hypothetical protein